MPSENYIITKYKSTVKARDRRFAIYMLTINIVQFVVLLTMDRIARVFYWVAEKLEALGWTIEENCLIRPKERKSDEEVDSQYRQLMTNKRRRG